MTDPSDPGTAFDRTVWLDSTDLTCVRIIDQRRLPFELTDVEIRTPADMADAISEMTVRGAGCIGVAAAYGMYLASIATRDSPADQAAITLRESADLLMATRPTAVNLAWAIERQLTAIAGIDDWSERVDVARLTAARIADNDVASCRNIGRHGLALIRYVYERRGRTVNVLTHCNAGWLAFVEHGSATAPSYAANDAGIPVHVWVGETRPRVQGALTAWELDRQSVAHTIVVDNAAGHLLQRGAVDLVIVGADRVPMRGDTANKIGTYMSALAARANDVPFYVALPARYWGDDHDGFVLFRTRHLADMAAKVGRRGGCELLRRCMGIVSVAELEAIKEHAARARVERLMIAVAREWLLQECPRPSTLAHATDHLIGPVERAASLKSGSRR